MSAGRAARTDEGYLLLHIDLVTERLRDRPVALRTRMKAVAADECSIGAQSVGFQRARIQIDEGRSRLLCGHLDDPVVAADERSHLGWSGEGVAQEAEGSTLGGVGPARTIGGQCVERRRVGHQYLLWIGSIDHSQKVSEVPFVPCGTHSLKDVVRVQPNRDDVGVHALQFRQLALDGALNGGSWETQVHQPEVWKGKVEKHLGPRFGPEIARSPARGLTGPHGCVDGPMRRLGRSL